MNPAAKYIFYAAVVLIVLILLTGCASEPYWTQAGKPLPVAAVTVTDKFPFSCRPDWGGCAVRGAGQCWIFIKPFLLPDVYQCVESHERRHCAGDTHQVADRIQLSMDCGDAA